ncbi:MAG: cyanophycinase [Firmicutes bacterium]|jgi:cyanophycinase|nr:cyanophycinase [Bacillota bacterium]
MGRKVQGNLVIIGGAEDKREDKVILREVVRLAGGRNAKVAVVAVAAEDQEHLGSEYENIFRELGVAGVGVVHVNSRRDASLQANVAEIAGATGVFFTGGDQLRITSLMGGTELDRELHRAYERGVVIAGTSAGASAMTDTMIVEGDQEDAPRNLAIRMAPGMGLLEEVVVDQHFAQRGRIGRLMLAVAQNPYILGVGIDEDTAVVVDAQARFKVIGSGTVTVIDGTSLEHSSVSERELNQPVAIIGATVHVLAPGYGFDLASRLPLPPHGAVTAAR